jgi:hypothetical protein
MHVYEQDVIKSSVVPLERSMIAMLFSAEMLHPPLCLKAFLHDIPTKQVVLQLIFVSYDRVCVICMTQTEDVLIVLSDQIFRRVVKFFIVKRKKIIFL